MYSVTQWAKFLRKAGHRAVRPIAHALGKDHLTFTPVSTCWPMQRYGSSYGGWIVSPEFLSPESICYCAGCGEDISFDLALIEAFGCTVHGFDPTPRAVDYVRKVADGNPRYKFAPIGFWDENTTLRFYLPENHEHASYSALNLQKTAAYVDLPVERLSRVMARLGHQSIDLLKLDIEGAEYRVIDSIVEDEIDIRALCVEFDEWFNPLDRHFMSRIKESVNKLLDRGFVMAAVDGNANYTFIHQQAAANKRS